MCAFVTQTAEIRTSSLLRGCISQSDKRANNKKREETPGQSRSERDATPQSHMAGPMMQPRQSKDYEGDSSDEDDSYIFGQQDSV